MFNKINTVVAGDYTGRRVRVRSKNCLLLCRAGKAPVVVDNTTVLRYDVLSRDVTKDGKSALLRGYFGKMLFGDSGMIAGSMSAKNKSVTTVSLEFVNGDKSLIEVDGNMYKRILRVLFK